MSSPHKPSTKQTLLPSSNINNLIVKDNQSQRSFDNLIKSHGRPRSIDSQRSITYTKLTRLPTLYEVLNRRTESPVDLWSFYIYMRDVQNSVEYLDFWIDVITHLRLCKDYVRGLRESLLLSEKGRPLSERENIRNNVSNDNIDNGAPNRESVSSSVLLEALINEGFLDDKDNHRVSSFLQGNEYVNINDQRLSHIFQQQQQSPEEDTQQLNSYVEDEDEQPLDPYYEPLSSPRKVFAGDIQNQHGYQTQEQNRNSTRIIPERLENYISKVKNGNISREKLKESSRKILVTYFQENSPKRLIIPDRIIRKLKHDIEFQGRDDPEIFDESKNFVYSIMERESFPFFLQSHALHNLNNKSLLVRLIVGLFSLFAAFWISYSLIFVDIQPKAIRAVILIPFFIGFYFLLSFLYKLDPLMVFLGYSDNHEVLLNRFESKKPHIIVRNLKEPFVKSLLRRRSIWVIFLIALTSAIFSLLFGLVPGHRL
ncbi:hypothetical protein WICMUC_004383 [Wickerhamomyces mucosus]|uniref:RGS domain-containing protein n=1 Tax=Wickerhamomyces mucosus TaxID=1378264 RepID=A0A9P8TAC8_9ASCO|nr:hypothetical protein WICMUC_004383 [Wickerhamomyces mucosus]